MLDFILGPGKSTPPMRKKGTMKNFWSDFWCQWGSLVDQDKCRNLWAVQLQCSALHQDCSAEVGWVCDQNDCRLDNKETPRRRYLHHQKAWTAQATLGGCGKNACTILGIMNWRAAARDQDGWWTLHQVAVTPSYRAMEEEELPK